MLWQPRPHKTTLVKVPEERIFITCFSRQYMTVLLTQNLLLSLMKLGSI
jgi:hypothetical protein